ncbi:MAG: metallophosphoesterase, partial [Clostridiales Family XIII bacterium]|nr:metallophosphoesterase [Clostridiales Family XIII bacterium]
MIYITGDTHGDFFRIQDFCRRQETGYEDIMIILGDAGINYYDKKRLIALKDSLRALPITFFCIHGNHEKRPQTVAGYEEEIWNGGMVFVQREYPNLLFAKDGEIYDFDGLRCIAIGGAYSVDKYHRLQNNWGWWADEQPSE